MHFLPPVPFLDHQCCHTSLQWGQLLRTGTPTGALTVCRRCWGLTMHVEGAGSIHAQGPSLSSPTTEHTNPAAGSKKRESLGVCPAAGWSHRQTGHCFSSPWILTRGLWICLGGPQDPWICPNCPGLRKYAGAWHPYTVSTQCGDPWSSLSQRISLISPKRRTVGGWLLKLLHRFVLSVLALLKNHYAAMTRCWGLQDFIGWWSFICV